MHRYRYGLHALPVVVSLIAAITLASTRASGQALRVGQSEIACGFQKILAVVETESDRLAANFGRTFVLLRLPRESLRTSVSLVRKAGPQDSLYRALVAPGDCVITNGGFWGYDSEGGPIPLGWLATDGKTVSRRMAWTSGGALCANAGTMTFVRARHLNSPPACEAALQSKPFIVEDGALAVWDRQGDRFNRLAIGVDSAGQIVIAGAFSRGGRAATLQELSTFALRVGATTGRPLVTLLALDGGPGAFLLLPQSQAFYGSIDDNFVPSVVRFSEHPKVP